MLGDTSLFRTYAEVKLEEEKRVAASCMREWKVHQLQSNLSIHTGLPFSSSLYGVTVCVYVKEVSIEYIFCCD